MTVSTINFMPTFIGVVIGTALILLAYVLAIALLWYLAERRYA